VIGATGANRTVGFNCPIPVSRQTFPKNIGQKMRRVPETHGFCNVTYATGMSYMYSDVVLMHTAYMESELKAICNKGL